MNIKIIGKLCLLCVDETIHSILQSGGALPSDHGGDLLCPFDSLSSVIELLEGSAKAYWSHVR